jgi:hypothetical protein
VVDKKASIAETIATSTFAYAHFAGLPALAIGGAGGRKKPPYFFRCRSAFRGGCPVGVGGGSSLPARFVSSLTRAGSDLPGLNRQGGLEVLV